MRNETRHTTGVTYIGPRTFVLAFCVVCAAFLAIFFGLDRVMGILEPLPADHVAVDDSGLLPASAASAQPMSTRLASPLAIPRAASAEGPSSLRFEAHAVVAGAAPRPASMLVETSAHARPSSAQAVPLARRPSAPTIAEMPRLSATAPTVPIPKRAVAAAKSAVSSRLPPAPEHAFVGTTVRHALGSRAHSPASGSTPHADPPVAPVAQSEAILVSPPAARGPESNLLVPLPSTAAARGALLEPRATRDALLIATPAGTAPPARPPTVLP